MLENDNKDLYESFSIAGRESAEKYGIKKKKIMTKSIKKKLLKKILNPEKIDNDPEIEMKKAFKILCEEGYDKITFKSLKKICNDIGENITDDEIKGMINEADKDNDNEVGEDDFIKIMQKTNMF